MAKVRARRETGKLYFDFFYRGARCREQTDLPDTPANRKRVEAVMQRIRAEIAQGVFDYAHYFPNSRLPRRAEEQRFAAARRAPSANAVNEGVPIHDVPTFAAFVDIWLGENDVRWRRTTKKLRREMIDAHLIPTFGGLVVDTISRPQLLAYRASLARRPGRSGQGTLAPKTINEIMAVLLSILAEAADRYGFTHPGARVGRLKVPRHDIQPFSLDEAMKIIDASRADYRHYFTVRFFTGMRTGEVHGLKWKYVDFERRQILVRESFTQGEQDGIKTDGSMREIAMSQQVFDALSAQRALTQHLGAYVFCQRTGKPIDLHNFVARVWNPLLSHLGLARRRPYQMRHTAATLWLAAGENPEWIARQLGHTTTELLFRVYSRFVPNLTRHDGSAFERMLAARSAQGDNG
ncbi:MAG: site-specific integrase [Xanthomonadales bacterium]|nr:site-specific integrase [Xanthomonadales bacterium]